MPVALGQVSRNIYDAAGALLQNKQIETQKAIALAQIRAANQRAALGAAQSALGAANANNERAKDRQLQQQRDAEQRRLQQEYQRKSRLQQLLEAINKENERWLREVDRMRQRGFMHNPGQQAEIDAIDRKHDEFVDLINEKISRGDMAAAEAIAMQLQNEQKKRWKYAPRTEIPPEFKEVDGQKLMRDAQGNWEPIRNFAQDAAAKIERDNQAHADRQATIRASITKTASEVFQRAYSTGTDYNTAADLEDKHLQSNGLPPTGMPRKSAGDPGYYMNDPNKLSQSEKRLEKDTDYLRTRRDKIMDELRNQPDEKTGLPRTWKPGAREKAFDEIWKGGGYADLEQRVESERRSQSQAATIQPVSEIQIPQDVVEAKAFLDKVTAMRESGWRSPDPQGLMKSLKEANAILKGYESQNPGKLSALPSAPSRATQAQQAPAVPPQAQGVRPQPAPQQAPQAAQPPVAPAPQGPFRKGNFLNGPRAPQTSSLSGSGLGRLAMMGDPLSGLYERGEPAQAPRDTALATAPDASAKASGEVEDQVGFIEKMKAWLERNPQPSSAYMGVKGTTNPNQSAYPTYQKDGRVFGGDLPPQGVPVGQYQLQKTLGDVQSRSQGGYQSAGSAIPGFRGGGVAPQLNPSAFSQALSELDDWEKANPGQDVSAIRKAIGEASSKLPDVFGEGVPFDSKFQPKPYQGMSPSEIESFDKMVESLVRKTAKPSDPVSKIAQQTKALSEIGKNMIENGASRSTAIEATKQIAKANASTGGKLLGGLSTGLRSVGGLGNALSILGFAASHLQDTKQFLDQQFRDWAVNRMAAENNQADQFGIPRSEARRLSNSIDGYAKGLDQGHLSQMRAKADKMVPPVPQSQSQTTAPSEVAKSRPQTPQMTVSPFAFVNESELRQRMIDQFLDRKDALPNRGRTEQGGEQERLEQKTQEIQRSWDDVNKYPWEKFKQAVADLASSWADSKGGPSNRANDDLRQLSKDARNVGDWSKDQPSWTKPRIPLPDSAPASDIFDKRKTTISDAEWKKLQNQVGNQERQGFFGPHFDKPGSYTRRDGEQRYNPDASRQQSNQNQIQVARDADGNVKLTNGAGQEMLMRPGLKGELFPGSESGASSAGRELTADREYNAQQKLESQAVTFLGLSGNGQHPGEDGKPATEAENFTARSKTTQLNDTMRQLDAKGELPPSLLEFPDKFPSWVTRLPAATWRDKDGKEHHRNDVPTDEEGLQNLVNEISKQKEIGKYSPEAKAAEKAAQEGEQPAAEGDPNADQAPVSASLLSPEMQEHHLRTPKPPTKEAFEKGLRDNGLQPQPGEYEEYLQARQAVRSAPQVTGGKDGTAPGNLFLDKDGTLKQSDGKSGKPFGKDQPLPPGYKSLVPQPNQQPFQGQPQQQGQRPQQRQVGPMDIARGAAEARRKQAAEDARNPRQQLLDQMDRQKLEDARNFGQPPPVQKRIAPRPLDRKDFQIPQPGVPAGAGIQGRASFTPPTFDDFSPQGQFPQQSFPSLGLGSSQPNYDNSIASSGFSPQYLPQSQSFQPTYQPQYAQPSFDQPFTSYQAPQYEQPYFQPQFDNFSYQPQFEPVGQNYFPDFNYSPQPTFTPFFDSPGIYYESSPGYYAPGDYGGYGDYSGLA